MPSSRSYPFPHPLRTPVLLVANLFQPVDVLTIEHLLDGDMCHTGCGCRAMPMFFARWEPHYVARSDFLDRTPITLNPAKAGHDDQRLSKWVRMPSRAGTWLESNASRASPGWIGCLEQRIDAHASSEVVVLSSARGL